MNRRELFKIGTLAGAYTLVAPKLALAQSGGGYRELGQPLPRTNPGKIEVIEFFWYGCGHCFHFEPKVQAWKKTLADDVMFRQVPVGWPSKRANFEGHQKLFYALEAMGVLAEAHQKVFDAIHVDKKTLKDDTQIFDFAESIGLNREKFANTFNSFAVVTKAAQAKKLVEAFQIDGVPSMGIDGKFVTSSTLAGSEEDALRVTDLLIKRQRQAGVA